MIRFNILNITMNRLIHALSVTFLIALMASCGGKKYVKSPVDVLIRDIPSDRVFSIMLNDMDAEGTFFTTYKHQYKVIMENEEGIPEELEPVWKEVEENFFDLHVNNMGMEIASRGQDGKLIKTASPPGYNNYVGNERYGHWENRGGSSFWAFYGQYAFMSSMFRMSMYPVNRSYYQDYRTSYYGTGRSYYGPTNGSPIYGTGSRYTTTSSPNSSWSRQSSSFKQRVMSRTSRSGSRYSGTSSRSSGGGYGK